MPVLGVTLLSLFQQCSAASLRYLLTLGEFAIGNVNSVEWNDGMERWSGLLEWSTGLDYWSAPPTKHYQYTCTPFHGLKLGETAEKHRSLLVWVPGCGTQTIARPNVKTISAK